MKFQDDLNKRLESTLFYDCELFSRGRKLNRNSTKSTTEIKSYWIIDTIIEMEKEINLYKAYLEEQNNFRTYICVGSILLNKYKNLMCCSTPDCKAAKIASAEEAHYKNILEVYEYTILSHCRVFQLIFLIIVMI